jgi:hypothetical protein
MPSNVGGVNLAMMVGCWRTNGAAAICTGSSGGVDGGTYGVGCCGGSGGACCVSGQVAGWCSWSSVGGGLAATGRDWVLAELVRTRQQR